MKKILIPEINNILNSYLNSQDSFMLSNIIDSNNDNILKKNNLLIVCDNTDVEILKDLYIINEYNNIYFYTTDLYNPEHYQEWCIEQNIEYSLKFDLTIILFHVEMIKNYTLLNFIMSDSSKGIAIFLNPGSFYGIRKALIDLDFKNSNSTIQRFKNFTDHNILLKELKIFKNIVITYEEIDINCNDVIKFLKNEDNEWFLTKNHFNSLEIVKEISIKENNLFKLILSIVIFKKNNITS